MNLAIPIPPQQQRGESIPTRNHRQQQTQTQQQNQSSLKTEDDDGANSGTTSIDTFQEYKPTALPSRVVRACNEWYRTNIKEDPGREGSSPEGVTTSANHANRDVIDLTEERTDVDADPEIETIKRNGSTMDPMQESETPPLALSVPSHTSSACESALLSSVAAPMVPLETAECLLPLLSTPPRPHAPNDDGPPHAETPPLSPLQLEGVLLSIHKHRRIHHGSRENGPVVTGGAYRAGFFLGDGAGIGKGRQIAAILRDGFCRGRKRHVWMSVSRELIRDAERDLVDVGVHCARDSIHDGTRFLGDGSGSKNGLGRKDKGVLFLTYNLLVSANRIEQIIAWCAGTEHVGSGSDKSRRVATSLEESFDGCIVFDEAHKAKNLADNTKTAQLVLMLQRRLPMARVVYCSATGVSDVDQLAYAERLGLWKAKRQHRGRFGTAPSPSYDLPDTGDSCGGFADFDAFRRSLNNRGLGSLELLALELKTRGSFMARTLSWEGAEFRTAEVPLAAEQRIVYDRSVAWWNRCKTDLAEALVVLDAVPGSGKSHAAQLWGTFWAAHQRCFKELAICAKVPFLARDALRRIHEDGCCVVFGLQGTGEAGMQSLLSSRDDSILDADGTVDTGNSSSRKNKSPADNDSVRVFPGLVSTVAACLINFVKQHFPVAPFPPDHPSLPKHPPTNDLERRQRAVIEAEIHRIRSLPPPQPIPALVEKRHFLLDAVRHMNLPPNPLDDLIDRLGGADAVAEMTGRAGRILRETKHKSDRFVYSKRVAAVTGKSHVPAVQRGEDSDRVNLIERRSFMDGSKPAAIISDAASTGVSLHAARGSGAGHKRRIHYTIELPWSADKAVQQLGRSHRSGQESAPVYQLVVTNLGGERRFAAAVSKRLASLGALTKGDRRAATGSDMSEFDLDSKYGKRALKRFYNALEENEASCGESSAGLLGILSSESGRAKSIIEEFITESTVFKDPIVQSLPNDDQKLRNACVLSIAIAELERVGLDKDMRSKADVRVFLNRLSGLMVSRQTLVFSLFMSTLGSVINTAKTSGEFEGTAEDISATTIEIGNEVDLADDPSSGAQTKLTTLILDRGIAFRSVRALAMEEAEKSSPVSKNDSCGARATHPKLAEGAKPGTETLTNDVSEDGSITNDDGEDENERNDFTNRRIAESGFYVSKNRFRGRHLVLFAKRKFDHSAFKTDDERFAVDPLGLMQIIRPNTGANITDKSTRDLRQTYRLALSCEKIKELVSESVQQNDDAKRFVNVSKKISSMWKLAFKESDSFKHENGLAPRRQKVSLVHGPVLHILPSLENVVRFRSEKEKALKIMRAQVGTRRIVGVRFPSDAETLEKLRLELDTIRTARTTAGKTFTDEALSPVCPKTTSWATTERKTMKSFFKVTPPSAKSVTNTPTNAGKKHISSNTPMSRKMNSFFKVTPPSAKSATNTPSNAGKKRISSNTPMSRKKTKTAEKKMTMLSYFAKKK